MPAARSSSACRPSPSPTATRSPGSSAPTTSCARRARAGRRRSRASLPAARLCLAEGLELTALPRDRAGWARLCRLLTARRRGARPRASCLLRLADLDRPRRDDCTSSCTCPPAAALAPLAAAGARLRPRGIPHAHLVASPRYDGAGPPRASPAPRGWRAGLGLPLVASAEPIMHHGSRRRLVDVLTCIREGRRIDTLGRAALANAERRLRSEAEMLRLFAGHEAAVHRSGEIAEDCRFRLDELRYEYPKEIWEGEDPQARLARLTARGPEVALSRTACRRRSRAQAAPRARADRPAGLRALLPHRQRRRRLRPRPGHPLPGPRLGGELGRLLRPRHHRGLARGRHHGLRALRLRGPRRAARHRRRLRARAARGGDPVHLPPLRPRARRHLRHGHPLPRQAGDPRGRHRHGALAATPSPRSPSQIWGWGGGSLPARAAERARPRPDRPAARADPRARRRDRRLPAPPLPARRRLRHHRGPARRAGADRERGDGGPHRHLPGTRTTSTPSASSRSTSWRSAC